MTEISFQLITSDSSLQEAAKDQNWSVTGWKDMNDRFSLSDATNTNEVDYEKDVLIIDLNIPSIGDRNRHTPAKVKSISSKIHSFLKRGGVAIYLLGEITEHRGYRGKFTNISCLPNESVKIRESSGHHIVNIVNETPSKIGYLKYVDVSLFAIESVGSVELDTLAVSMEDRKQVAGYCGSYMISQKQKRDYGGKAAILPRAGPTEPISHELISSLSSLAMELSPISSVYQQKLHDFPEYKSNEEITDGDLDSELASRCLPKYNRGEYADAAQTAGQILEERTRHIVEGDVQAEYGADLMKQAFSSKEGPIQISENDGEQEGIMFLYAGIIQAIRNPLSHRTPKPDKDRYLDHMEEKEAHHIICFIDFLLGNLIEFESKENHNSI